MFDFQFFDNGGAVRCDDDLSQVVYDQFIHAVGAERRPCDCGYFVAGLDVAKRGALEALHALVAFFEHSTEAGGLIVRH